MSLNALEVRKPLSRAARACAPPYSVSSHMLLRELIAQVNGERYALFECVYLRPWPKAEPWIARIEEILSQIGNGNKIKHSLGVRWFYRRRDLLPSGESQFPACDDDAREVYLVPGKLDEVETKTLLGPCKVACSTDVPDLAGFLQEDDTYFYKYEYDVVAARTVAASGKQRPLFALPGGKPIAMAAAAAADAESAAAASTAAAAAAASTACAMPPPSSRPAKRARADASAEAAAATAAAAAAAPAAASRSGGSRGAASSSSGGAGSRVPPSASGSSGRVAPRHDAPPTHVGLGCVMMAATSSASSRGRAAGSEAAASSAAGSGSAAVAPGAAAASGGRGNGSSSNSSGGESGGGGSSSGTRGHSSSSSSSGGSSGKRPIVPADAPSADSAAVAAAASAPPSSSQPKSESPPPPPLPPPPLPPPPLAGALAGALAGVFAAPTSPAAAEASGKSPEKRQNRCGKCGQIKRGHICTAADVDINDVNGFVGGPLVPSPPSAAATVVVATAFTADASSAGAGGSACGPLLDATAMGPALPGSLPGGGISARLSLTNKSHEERLSLLQEKLDRMWPPFVNVRTAPTPSSLNFNGLPRASTGFPLTFQ